MPAVPWMWQVVAPLFQMRKWVGVAAAPPVAVPDQAPSSVFDADAAAFIQSDGKVISQSRVPESAAAQFAGCEPEKMGFLGIGNNPMVGCTVAVAVDVAQALGK